VKIPLFTMYTKSAGLEISPYEKRQEGKPCEGRISLRFFSMEGGSQHIRFVAHPSEGFELHRMINSVYLEGEKKTLVHKFEGEGGEIITKLSVEKYEKNGKAGYAFIIQRGNESINIPTTVCNFLYAAELLRHLSLTEAWAEQFHQTQQRPATKE